MPDPKTPDTPPPEYQPDPDEGPEPAPPEWTPLPDEGPEPFDPQPLDPGPEM